MYVKNCKYKTQLIYCFIFMIQKVVYLLSKLKAAFSLENMGQRNIAEHLRGMSRRRREPH